MGWYYTKCANGILLRRDSPVSIGEILKKYYNPHHITLEKEVRSLLNSHGKCLVLDGHSFYPKPLPYETDQAKDRPDFCIDTDSFHTPERLTAACVSFLEHKGFSVKVNSPFSGAMIPMKYYRKDVRVSAIIIEVNKRLYMRTSTEKNKDFHRIKKTLAQLLSLLECLL